jgi:Xaa-Pro aminopeptidase
MKTIISSLLLLSLSFSQLVSFNDDINISKEEYKKRREALMSSIPDEPIVFIGNVSRNRINDTNYEFRQESNFYYFSGYNEPNAYMVLSKKPFMFKGKMINELIFVLENSLRSMTWTGRRLGTEGAVNKLGFEAATVSISGRTNHFEEFMKELAKEFPKFHLMTPIIDAKTPLNKNNYFTNYKNDLTELLQKELIDPTVKEIPETKIVEVQPPRTLRSAIGQLRGVKSDREIEMLQRAVDITVSGHQESFKVAKHVKHEYQVEAAIEFAFKFNGAEDVGYNSIVGCGENGTILHYETNRDAIDHEKIFCLDAGAEYHGYTADITRSFPASGKFTAAQKEIYNIVLASQSAGAEEFKAGSNYGRVNWATQKTIGIGLEKLGIIEFGPKEMTVAEIKELGTKLRSFRFAETKGEIREGDAIRPSLLGDDETKTFKVYNLAQVREIYPHGFGHPVGLDVHDMSGSREFKEGMVWTIEPGIYISNRLSFKVDEKYMNIGIRIEDMYLITKDGTVCMSEKLPREVDDIEAYMAKRSDLVLNSQVKK